MIEMKRIEVLDAEQIVRVTVADERWYAKATTNPTTGLPEIRYVPSVTWVASHYPKGIGFYKWLAQHGWDEAQAIRQAAADKGSKVHQALAALIDGQTVTWNTATFLNPSTGQPEAFSTEEWEAIASFVAWVKTMIAQHGPLTTIARDFVCFSEAHNIAGTLDWLVRFARERFARLIDFKSGRDVWPEHEIQLTGYRLMLPETLLTDVPNLDRLADGRFDVRLGLLQVGYQRNKARYRYHEVAEQFDLFAAAQRIWLKEQEGVDVFKAEYPLTLTLNGAPALELAPPQPGKAKARKARR